MDTVQKTAKGVVEITKEKNYSKVRDVYDELIQGNFGSADEDFERIRDRARKKHSDLQHDRDGDGNVRNSRQAIPGETQNNARGGRADSPQSDSGTSPINFSTKLDSTDSTLSPEQQEYFKDSKVLDEDGNLLVVYHGTDADFCLCSRNRY